MKRFLMSLAATALIAGPALAQDYRAENRVAVTPVEGGFNISSGAGFGARGMWCAAADYAQKVLGASGTDRIYVAQARSAATGGRAPVTFTLDPTGLTPRSVLILSASLRTPGANLSADHAYQFCADSKLVNR